MNLLLVALSLVSSDTAHLDDPKTIKISIASAESLAVTISGPDSGAPLVLIPGLFGSQFGFRKVVPPLNAAGYRTIVIEPLGVGSSSRPQRADYSLTAQADRIAQVLDSLNVDHAVVVAHALGAAMGLRLAYRRPDLVRGLVSLDGGPSESAVTPTFKRMVRIFPWVKLLGGVGLVRRKTRETMVHSSGDTTWVTDEVVAEYTAGVARDLDGSLKAYMAMAAAKEREHLEPHLGEVSCPVRLVVGAAAHGGNVKASDVALLQENVRVFALDSIPGAGHYLHEERPDAVVDAVARLELTLASSVANHK